MATKPQFRSVPTTSGETTLIMNPQCRDVLVTLIKGAVEAGTIGTEDPKFWEAMVREIEFSSVKPLTAQKTTKPRGSKK